MSPRLHAISAAVAAAIATLAAHAQEATPTNTDNALDTVEVNDEAVPFRQFRGVEVTGTAIINPTARQALPVRVIDRREIERTGATNVVQLLQRLPLMHGFTELGGYNAIGKGGYQSAAIHGYEEGTLVLINGRRQAAVPLQRADLDRTAADIGLLPLSAIDRVEILTDGASSLYGSEAIAGVINIITREQTQGLRISAETSDVTTANKQGNGLGLSWGTGNLLKDRYNIQVHLSANQQDPIAASTLPWTSQPSVPIGTNANGEAISAYALLSTFGYPGRLFTSPRNANDCPDGYAYVLARHRSFTAQPTYVCEANPAQDLYIYPKVDNRRLHTQFEWITPAQHALFAEWSRQEQDVNYIRGASINNFLTNPNGQTVVFNLYPWFPLQKSISLNRDRYVIGSKGLVGAWNYRVSFMASDNRETVTDSGGITPTLTSAQIRNTLAPFHAELLKPFSEGSPAFLQALESLRDTTQPVRRIEKNELRELNLTASRTVGETEWGDIQLAMVGFATEQRMSYQSPSDPLTNPSYSAARRNHGLASEIQWPATARVNITGALRTERYSDVGSVLTGKLGAKYQISDHTFVRASAGTGYRAPTLAQMAPSESRQSSFTSTNGVREVWAKGNPDLRPETSVQHSIGIQSAPNQNWAIGVDWWQFNVNDAFGSLSVAEIDRDPALLAQYFRNRKYYRVPLNLGQLNKSGIDYNVQYRHPLSKGVFTVGLEGTHNLRSKRTLQSGQDSISDLGNYQDALHTVTPRNKLRLTGTIGTPQLGWRAAVNYQSGNTEPMPILVVAPNGRINAAEGETHRVRSHLTLDIGGWYQIRQRLRLVWNIENITNATPPLRLYDNSNSASTVSNYPWSDTRYNDYRGRVFNARLEWQLW